MTPTVYTRSEAGLYKSGTHGVDSFNQGMLGVVRFLTIHHTAGQRVTTVAQAKAVNRSIQAGHVAKGWGDYAYHFSMDDMGRFYHGRPLAARGAHVARNNSNNAGLVLHGNYETDRPTKKQIDSLTWLFRGGFYTLLGVHERSLTVRTHNEWPQQGTACCGDNLAAVVRGLRRREM